MKKLPAPEFTILLQRIDERLTKIEQWRDDAKEQRERYRSLTDNVEDLTELDDGLERHERMMIAAAKVAAYEDVLRLFGK